MGAGLLLTCGMIVGAYQVSPPKYEASALVLLLPGRSEVAKGGNPFLLLDGLEQPAGILTAYFSSEPARAEVERISKTAQYEVVLDDSVRGPVISVSVTDESPQETVEVLSYLLQRLPDQLASLQRQVDARGSTVIGSMPLTVDTQPKMSPQSTIRAMIAALLAGLLGTVLSAVALDTVMRRREAQTRSEASDVADEAPPPTTRTPVARPVAFSPRAGEPTGTRTTTESKTTTEPKTTSTRTDGRDRVRSTASGQPREETPVSSSGSGWSWGEDGA